MELTKLKDNVLMNQVGGESVRTALLLNANDVLEFYSTPNGLETRIIDVSKYIFEEFINYRHELDQVYNVLDNHIEVFKNITDYTVKDASEYKTCALINGKYTIIFENDAVFLKLE